MLKGLTIQNFKAFKEEQNIPIRPITLIFGENSSGKSSIIHSLLYNKEAYNKRDANINTTQISGDTVELGGEREFIFGKEGIGSVFSMGFEYEQTRRNQFPFEPETSTSIISIKPMRMMFSSSISLLKSDIKVDNVDLMTHLVHIDDKGIAAGSHPILFEKINYNHPCMKKFIDTKFEEIKDLNSDSSVGFTKKMLEKGISEYLEFIQIDYFGGSVPKYRIGHDRLKSYWKKSDKSSIEQLVSENVLEHFLIFCRSFTKDLESILNSIIYLGPFRYYPPRHFYVQEMKKSLNWLSSGGDSWLALLENESLRNKVNMWLSDKHRLDIPYRWVARKMFSDRDIKYLLNTFFDLREEYGITTDEYDPDNKEDNYAFLHQEELDAIPQEIIDELYSTSPISGGEKGVPELMLEDINTGTILSHKEVGIGISQVMPVIVRAIDSEKKIVCIEEPDIHVHPGLQARLGDVFIESALVNKNTLILETHSEHLLLRLLRRIKEGYEASNDQKFTSNDLSVIYTKKENGISKAIEMEVDKKGKFKGNWPKDFFDERSKELF